MLISLATMDFRLCYLLREKLSQEGFSIEQLLPGNTPSKESILVVTTEEESNQTKMTYENFVILSKVETLNIDKAYSKIMLGIEGKKIWESLIIGIDPGFTIGIAVVTDSCLRSTLETRDIKEDLIFHSDRGIQYACTAFTNILNTYHGLVRQSMSRKGNCHDNAVAKSFFSHLKNELVYHQNFADRDEARSAIFDYIEVFYNRQRLYQTLGYQTPVNYEMMHVA